MNPDSSASRHSYALLASGAGFSCAVLQALMRRHRAPRLLVLPEFPPASNAAPPGFDIVGREQPRLLELAGDIDVDYEIGRAHV